MQPIKYNQKLIDVKTNSFNFFEKFYKGNYGTYYLRVKNRENDFDKNEVFETHNILNKFEANCLLQVIYRSDDSYFGYLTELFNTPFILSPRRIDGYHQTNERIGSDCAAFAIYGKRRQGYDVFYGGPRGIYNYLEPVIDSVIYLDMHSKDGIYKDVNKNPISTINTLKAGDIIHFKEQVSVFYKDEGILGLLDENDLLIQSYDKTPYITTIKDNGFYKKPFKIFRWNLNNTLAID